MAAELTDEQIEAAAKVVVRYSDTPWVMLPETSKMKARAVAEEIIRAALATRQATVTAWMNPETLDVINDQRKEAWMTINGAGGKMLAKGYTEPLYTAPPPTAEVEKKAARYDWLRNDASEDEQNRWLYRLPEQADEYADKRIAALQSDQAQVGKDPKQ